MFKRIGDRLGPAAGLAYVVCVFVGNAISSGGGEQGGQVGGQQVIADTLRQSGSASATLGFVLEFLGFLALMGFIGYLAAVSGARRPAAITAVVAGGTVLAIKLGSVVPATTLFVERRTIAPSLAQALADMGTVAFVLTWLPFAVFVWAVAIALLGGHRVGRPTAYIGVVLGVAGVLLGLLGINDPMNAVPIGFLLINLWLLVIAVRFTVHPPAQLVEAPPARHAVPAEV